MKKLLIYTWLPALLVAFVTIGFTACGSDDDDDPTTPPETEQGPTGGDSTTEGEGNEEENDGTSQEPAITVGEAIDLGFSVKWASCNVGATEPWEYGGYYAWGETEEKDDDTYKWYNGEYYIHNQIYHLPKVSKYCIDSNFGTVDNKTILDPCDDVATVKLGDSWRMPTTEEQKELILMENCLWKWSAINDINGFLVTGPNGNSIFLPAAGTASNNKGSKGYYYSSSLSSQSLAACGLYFHSGGKRWDNPDRHTGLTVRPVYE